MSLRSPTNDADASTSRDPFQLERLAEELAVRETNKPEPTLDADGTHDLPIYLPLSHDNSYLSSETFDAEEFLLSRLYTSLPDLRLELRVYSSTLREELVKLINDDYEAFISLSTDLRGEGARLERLKRPLGDLKARILDSRGELQLIQDAIQEKLQKRATLREDKTFLHLLLKISESVTRLESLLLIALPDQDSPERSDRGISSHLSIQEDEVQDDKIRGNRAKHLSRVAAEFTQLLYHVSKAQDQQSAFIDEIRWRVDRIRSTLSSDLDHLFAFTLKALMDGREEGKTIKGTEAEKAKWMADLTECLKSYDILGLWRDAEDVLRRDIVRGFIKNTIFPGSLTAPHSPLLPHTPFPAPQPRSFVPLGTTSYAPPRTPYTPFTAFASKQDPFEYNSSGPNRSSVPFLDDSDNALALLYNRILRFVDRDLMRIMEAADRVTIKSGARAKGVVEGGKSGVVLPLVVARQKRQDKEGGGEDGDTFEIMANVVWAEIGRAIMDELGSVVFAAGRPDEFRKNYETTQAFIRSLEFLAPSILSVEAMRSHPVYAAFERRWQLPVYFQLRWKDIVTKLEEVLIATRIEPVPLKEKEPFVTSQAAAVWAAVQTCWSAEVYIPELSHRFWRFTLQLLSRYKTWLDSSLQALEPSKGMGSGTDRSGIATPTSSTRATTPVPPGVDSSSADTTAADDALLRQFGAAITDIKTLESQILKLWREEISMMLPDTEDVHEDGVNPQDALYHVLKTLTSFIPPMSNQIVSILTRRACEAVQAVRSIPASLRAMSMKRTPTEPSYFVPTILQPVKAFFGVGSGEGPGTALRDNFLKDYSEEVFENTVQRYIYWITSLRKTEESLRRLQKGKKQGFSLFGNTSSGRDDKGKDEERIRSQMILDVQAFGQDATSLGVNVQDSQAFRSLNDMVYAALAEDP